MTNNQHIYQIKDIAHVKGGKRLPKGETYSESKTNYPYLRVCDFHNRSIKTDNLLYLSKDTQQRISRYIISKKDIYISIAGTIGVVGAVPDHLNGANLTENAAKLVIYKPELVCREYLIWFLATVGQLAIASKTKATSQPKLALFRIKELEIPLPPLPEQKRIAALLDKADAIRRKRQQAIDLADDFLRSVFLDMFGDLSNKVDPLVTLGEVTLLDAKMIDPRKNEYLNIIHYGPDRIEKETGRLLPALTAKEERLISKKFIFDQRYVMYSKIRPYLKKCALAPKGISLCSADMYPIKPHDKKMTREFLWMLLLSGVFTKYTETLPARANIPKLNRKELANFSFHLPSLTLQKKFTLQVIKINEFQMKIANSKKEKEDLFNALSQQAFAGKL